MNGTPEPARPLFEDFTVDSLAPLRIKRTNSDATALAFTPDSMVSESSLTVGDRVRVELADGRMIVHGKQDGVRKGAAGTITGDLAIIDQLPVQNLIINGTFRTNQRGYVSATSVADNTYFFDRWKNISGSATSTITYTAAPQGQILSFAGSGNAAQTRRICQIVERANIDPGNHVLSWEGIAVGRVYNFGSTPPAFAASPIVANLDGSADVVVEFANPTNVVTTLYKVKLERGSVPTPFVLDPLAIELLRCYRYFFRATAGSSIPFGWGYQISTTQAECQIPTPVPLRTTPTVTAITTIYFSDRVSYNATVTSFTGIGASGTVVRLLANWTGAAGAQFRPGELYGQTSTSTVDLNAEL